MIWFLDYGNDVIWVVAKLMVPFWVLSIIRHLVGTQKGTPVLTTTHLCICIDRYMGMDIDVDRYICIYVYKYVCTCIYVNRCR